jgi:membrane-associated phospholipid phosphatase
MRSKFESTIRFAAFSLCLFVFGCVALDAQTTEVTDWTQIMLKAIQTAGTNPVVSSRNAAIMEASVFDAVNGVKGKYTPIHVTPAAPKGTSARAAAVQAAYASLVQLYPSQTSTFDAARTNSLNAILAISGGDNRQQGIQDAVSAGLLWGQQVADQIWAWRSTDGFSSVVSPYLGGSAVGQWRPTPPGFLPGALPQFATMTPWVLASPSQFRPAGPQVLTSQQYATDLNETKLMGSATSLVRTVDQTLLAKFWQSASATYFWNSVALELVAREDMPLIEHAHLFGELNVAIADAVIANWDAKYYYSFWRPVTAIALADTDGNPATEADPTWVPLITTPNFPEYPSAHSTFSSAGTTVLANFFGANTPFSVDSFAMPGVTRSFASFDDALTELVNARVFGGIHFRSSCKDGQTLGTAVGTYVLQNAFLPGSGDDPEDEE